ncbi:MAG TPA: alpha/beta hydrolase [Thermoanaerobaculia bacterium]|jgi:pimeloyl-ACP methyl ester carboxylesterase|nr:alpha/beta hydrolase [Thermoanaerobaculia bacterium]
MLLLLLPGMDGTGDLFAPFVNAAPPNFEPRVVRLPDAGNYDELHDAVAAHVPRDGAFAVLAESFSGPLALELARRHPDRVRAVILCNTFIAAPRWWLRFVPWRVLLAVRAPRSMVQFLFGWGDAARVIRSVDGSLMAVRLRAIAMLSVVPRVKCPVLYLRGTKDRLVSRASVERILRVMPEVVVKEIDGPHLLLQVRANEAWAAIGEFVMR